MLSGKVALVTGIANHRSIAWAVAERWVAEGAEVVLSVQSERFVGRAEALKGAAGVLTCDLRSEGELAALGAALRAGHGGRVDAVLHSAAWAPTEAMRAPLLQVSAEDWGAAQAASVHSLIGLVRALEPLLGHGSSVSALSYLGAQRAVQEYGVMGPAKAALEATARALAVELGPRGVRVNAISAGPIATMAARGIPNFHALLDDVAARAPLGRNITAEEVAGVAAMLASDAASGMTGQVVYVDGGFSSAM